MCSTFMCFGRNLLLLVESSLTKMGVRGLRYLGCDPLLLVEPVLAKTGLRGLRYLGCDPLLLVEPVLAKAGLRGLRCIGCDPLLLVRAALLSVEGCSAGLNTQNHYRHKVDCIIIYIYYSHVFLGRNSELAYYIFDTEY